MKNCDEMVNNLLERREQYNADKKRKRKAAMRISSVICCFLLVAVVGFGVWQSGIFNTHPSSTQEGVFIPGKIDDVSDYTVIWADTNNETEDNAIVEWNGKQVVLSLLTALQNAPQNSKVAIMARPHIDDDFVYNGKTLAEYYKEAENERNFPDKLWQLIKVGESLKYGETLYQTGTPDGEKWAQSLYEETIEFFGEDLLSKYIVDGVFLKEKVEADIDAAQSEKTAQNAYELACCKYFEQTINATAKQIDPQAIDYDIIDDADFLIIFASENEFAALSFDGIENWYFSFAVEDYNDSISNVGSIDSPTKIITSADIEQLKTKYPMYFDLSTSKGLEVYIWQMAEDTFSCGLLSGKNRNYTQEELLDLHKSPTSVEEMRIIVASYIPDITQNDVVICPIQMPHSSYAYNIDEAYREKITNLFWDGFPVKEATSYRTVTDR